MSTVLASDTGGGHVGKSLKRKEDPRLLTGRGSYVDDMTLPGLLYCSFVRSPEAHAKVVSIDTSAAKARPDVAAVFTADDLDLLAPLPMGWVPPGVDLNRTEHWPLAKDAVHHVGDPVAVVIGTDRYTVIDATEDVVVEYDPLPVVTDIRTALADDAPLAHDELGTNLSHVWSLGGGSIEEALATSDVVIEREVVNHRISGAPIEPRGCMAEDRAGQLTIWSSTQVPHLLRLFLTRMMGISEERTRVVAPDVGGGFGVKVQIYGEEVVVACAAKKLGRPVKWIETRSEHMATAHHGRDQIATVKMGAMRDGTLTGIQVHITADMGAYHMLLTPAIPCVGAFVMSGCYKFKAVHTDVTAVFTNKCPTDAIRGAGRPEAAHMIEVCIDQLAHELGIDRLELRRKNFPGPEEFPYKTPIGVVYDSGNYPGSLAKLLEHFDVDAFKVEQEQLRTQGIYRGVGFSTWTEVAGMAPSRFMGPEGFGLQGGNWESAVVRVHVTGTVTVYTGASPHGQGLDTTLAQVVADKLGVDPDAVEVRHGDTSTGPQGHGTYGSRSTAVGGEAVARAADKVAAKCCAVVGHLLEAAPEDIELRNGKFIVRGSPDTGIALAQIAGTAYLGYNLPEGMEPGLEEMAFFDPSNFVFPFGAHACVVDVDTETGKVTVIRYVAVDDCGPAINPMIIDGQIHGGIAHSIGQTLFENVHYDEDGQLTTGTFVDYALPTAAELPSFETDRTETPSPINSLGVKGVGEAGTIAATPAVLNAVIDALRPLGVSYVNMPLSPLRVWEAISEAKRTSA